ncbi:tryptophanyl-tRNA synthetase [Endozoicomonas montiporae]|uniref:Tryptophan--tRNA ligase n=2 Tax=Endozoicomonas montiporae TaxID=1027273 RepID=A0A081N238_9GAMM|nr:tryptophan--tRNA ligase [Endozoicomonas montiporae]AMO58534.1 tryptophanyl-tRNA synthetase [Endozoicomonas montiporae CL-33]KEQ12511.1 tryptophanyl-tRNA synthetase [Endozoicomonas montiporae]
MTKTKVLTGITTTGIPHLGNYVGAIKPAIEESWRDDIQSYYFMADYHAMVKGRDPKRIHESGMHNAATWLALGLDTDRATFYRQSDIPEIMELNWILSCMTAKGLMNRAHAYKAAVQQNVADEQNDPDFGITMGLFSYPVLMAADILIFNAHKVPVGQDQVQHLEMARDIAKRMNHNYKTRFVLPEAVVGEETAILNGLDGRKMSKSYDNTIPLFVPEKKLLKLIRKIKTNSLEPGEPKDPSTCTLLQIFSAFANEEEVLAKKAQYEAGAGWGDLKNELFEYVNDKLKGPRERYNELLQDPAFIEAELRKGAEKARAEAAPFLQQVRQAVGIKGFV